MNLNKVTLIGNLTGTPKVTKLSSGQSVTNFGLATNYRWRDYQTKELRSSVEFHSIVAWRRLGDVIGRYLKKGDRVFVEGRLQTRAWKGRDGASRKHTEIVAENIIMLGSRGVKSADKPNTELVQEDVSVEEMPAPAL